jgi:peptidoglycan hydrolase-like protein with peptidoglycan-binding domain
MTRYLFLLTAVIVLFGTSILAQSESSTAPTKSTTSTTTSSSSNRGPIFRPTKDQITEVQKTLKDKKLYNGEASGKYNDETRIGIKSFQKDNGLKETGTLNRATLEKFGVALTDTQKAIPVSPNSYASADTKATKPSTEKTSSSSESKKTIFRATADQVKAAQKMLKDRSMYSGDQTGKLDDATREGLKKYQDANGLKVTGTLNESTLEKMSIELTDKQKADAAAASSTTTKTTPN